MPNVVTFAGRQIVEPGFYSQIKGSSNVLAANGSFGNVCIIDTGSGKDYGWGAGISGELTNGGAAVYQFNTLQESKAFLRGGLLWDLMDYLWIPSTNGQSLQTLYYAKAATTVAPKFQFTFASAGAIQIGCKVEGLTGNGATVVGGTILSRGYGIKIKAGIVDVAKFIVEFYEGQYRGANANGYDYDQKETDVKNYLVTRSTEIANVTDFINWANNDFLFNQYFKIISNVAGVIAAPDLVTYTGFNLLVGGTIAYSSSDLDILLETIEDLDNSIFLCDDYGVTPNPAPNGGAISAGVNKGGLSSFNIKILAHVIQTANFKDKLMFVGGGQNKNEFNNVGGSGSVQIAQTYNSTNVVTIHSAVKLSGGFPGARSLFKELPSIYHAAMACGRTAGLEPQVPLTYKNIRVAGVVHDMKKSERELALFAGVVHLKNVRTLGWVFNQGVTTLQNNSNLIIENGDTPEISIQRIKHQLNKEMKIAGEPRFTGTNINLSSPEDVKTFAEGYLQSRIARPEVDNLIISFKNVDVQYVNGNYDLKYCFVANFPVNKTFATGFVLDPRVDINS